MRHRSASGARVKRQVAASPAPPHHRPLNRETRMSLLRIAAEKCRFVPPRQVTDDTSVLTLKNLVLEPLIRWEDGVLRPGLFADWSHDGTGRRWRCGSWFTRPCYGISSRGCVACRSSRPIRAR